MFGWLWRRRIAKHLAKLGYKDVDPAELAAIEKDLKALQARFDAEATAEEAAEAAAGLPAPALPAEGDPNQKQAVIIELDIPEPGTNQKQLWAVYAIEDALERAFRKNMPTAVVDGHEVPVDGAGVARIFLYGSSADRMAAIARRLVRKKWPHGNVEMAKRYDLNAEDEIVESL